MQEAKTVPVVLFPPEPLLRQVAALEAEPLPVGEVDLVMAVVQSGLRAFAVATVWGVACGLLQARLGLVSIAIGWWGGIGATYGGRGREVQIVSVIGSALAYLFGLVAMAVVASLSATGGVEAEPVLAQIVGLAIETVSTGHLLDLGLCLWFAWSIPAKS